MWWQRGPEHTPVSSLCTACSGSQTKGGHCWECLAEGQTDSCSQWVSSRVWHYQRGLISPGRANKSQLTLLSDQVIDSLQTRAELGLWAKSTPWWVPASGMARFHLPTYGRTKVPAAVCNEGFFQREFQMLIVESTSATQKIGMAGVCGGHPWPLDLRLGSIM